MTTSPPSSRGLLAADRGGVLVPAGARTPPVTGLHLAPQEVASVISMAARAPSLHNTQPWKFRPQEDCIELLADVDRLLPLADPDGRELMISCGAALFGLRLGLRQIGLLPAVELQPDLEQPWLVARVWPAGRAARTRVEADLIAAAPHRHTHRGLFSPGAVPDRLLAVMVADAVVEGCELVLITDPTVMSRLARIVRESAAEQHADPDMAAELARWVRPLHSQARDGVPATARLAGRADGSLPASASEAASGCRAAPRRSLAAKAPERLAVRDFGLPGTDDAGGHPPSVTAVLLTAGDTAPDWLRAGQALDRVLLSAAARWVFASLQSQPLESRRHRRAVRRLLGGHGHPQMILQFGRANIAMATPRRRHAEMLATQQPD